MENWNHTYLQVVTIPLEKDDAVWENYIFETGAHAWYDRENEVVNTRRMTKKWTIFVSGNNFRVVTMPLRK